MRRTESGRDPLIYPKAFKLRRRRGYSRPIVAMRRCSEQRGMIGGVSPVHFRRTGAGRWAIDIDQHGLREPSPDADRWSFTLVGGSSVHHVVPDRNGRVPTLWSA